MSFYIFCIFCAFLQSQLAADPLVTRSPLALDTWATAEITFLEKLLNYLTTVKFVQKPASDAIRKYLHDYGDSNDKLKGFENETILGVKVDAITSNPIATYRMVRRIVYELAAVKMHLEEFNLGLFEHFPSSDKWITTKDVEDAMMGILRVCHVYDFPIELFSNGTIFGINTGVQLNDIHCYEIGRYAKRKQMYTLSIQFLEIALRRSHNASIAENHIQVELDDSILLHDQQYEDPDKSTEEYFFTKRITDLRNEYGSSDSKERKTQRTALAIEYGISRDVDHNSISYWTLCSNGSNQSEEEKLELTCWYEKKDPYFRIGPMKMELLAAGPDVLQIYDVIGKNKIERLKNISSKSLYQSLIVARTDASGELIQDDDYFRTSVNAWVNERNYPELRSIALTIEKITGLKATRQTSTEDLQVASYTFTGHYEVHQDALGDQNSLEYAAVGDRIATFMFYLHEPKFGGSTVFPQSGIAAKPIQGSAVFWYNVYRDGDQDPMTFHGACPVILGRKWIANKWIRYYDQFLNRKCGLEDTDRFYIVPNSEEIVYEYNEHEEHFHWF